MILLSKEKIESLVATLDDGYTVGGCSLLFLKGLAKEQLKAMVKYLKTCKGELVSRAGQPFVATFGIPLEDWQSILEEIE